MTKTLEKLLKKAWFMKLVFFSSRSDLGNVLNDKLCTVFFLEK